MKGYALLFIVLLLCVASGAAQPRRQVGTQPADIGPEAVWDPPQVVWGRMQDECRPVEGDRFVECVVTIMEQAGASTQAVAFARLLKGEGYLDSFRKMGR